MDAFSQNDLIGLSHLFKLATANPQPIEGSVMVLVPVDDCERLADLLLAEARREQWTPISSNSPN